MLRYVLRRFLLLIPMVLAASVIIFLMLRLGTGDPALDYLRLSNLPPTPEMLASTRTMLGLDQPLYVQYGTWLWKALHLDFGISFASQRPVLDDMLNFLPATLELAGAALVLILLTSVPLGIWAARHRDRLPDFAVRFIAFLGVSMPNFWLAFLLVMAFSVYLQWLPAMGYGGWQHIILPAVLSMAGLVFDYEDPNYPPRKEGNRLTKEYYSAKEWQELFPVLINDGSFIGRTIQPSRVTKLFRRELVEQNLDLWDDRVTVGEDLQMVFAAAIDAKGVCVVPDYYPYHYWYNTASMTGQYDARYLEKIKLLRERMEAISDAKKGYDFRPQIRNDFLSLAIMAVKNEIWRNHQDSFFTVLQKTKEMCRDKAVQEALNNHTMRIPPERRSERSGSAIRVRSAGRR